jgi:ABC-type uncharacterized transport system substrate-binding protein
MFEIRRREFIAGLGGAAAWPLAARAQPDERQRNIGVLVPYDENDLVAKTRVATFAQALADLGWIEGRTLRVNLRWAGGDINRIRAFAQELVGLQPNVIVASGTLPIAALQRETQTIPIVMTNVADAIGGGFVPALNRPGGNITGFSLLEPSLGGKWLELLSEIAPGLKRVAIMFNADAAAISMYMPAFETAARSLKIEPVVAPIHSDAEIETAINAFGCEPGHGLVVPPGGMFVHRVPLVSAAARNKVPAVYWLSDIVRGGGLLSYGVDLVDIYRRAATYVDRILRGEKPGDLPVQLPTRFETAVNRKTAKALGLSVPPSILLRADEVIE